MQTTAQAAPSAPINHEHTNAPVNPKENPSPIVNGPNTTNGGSNIPHGHQKFVFTDPVALRYLEEDPSTIVLQRREELQGYEIYIVEQWACSRTHPTFVITTFTGEATHRVWVGVLSVPTDETLWSPRLKLYFNAVTKCHARRKETPKGAVIVTDLSTFPSALTVIPVPGGDIKRHREDFIVNENLKRLCCSGRAGLKLQAPSAATEAKFYQLYRTSERVNLYSAVMELVKQCQMALMMFGRLAPEYVDGLLCDVTEAAIGDWWADVGMDLYNIEPSDGVLGPTTVAALLGTLLGARNRLHAFGAPVGKDAFDISNLKRGVSSFQKSQKLKRSRRLDQPTLARLHRVTAKAANSEGWTDAVKSTMAELSGQGGEMVMGMVRGREKGGIADIETLDIDNFAHLVTGARAKWLWLGKPRKSGIGDGFASEPPAAEMMFTTNDQGGYMWTSRKRHSNEELATDRSFQGPDRSWKQPETATSLDEKDQNLSRMVLKGVSGKVSDARIGFGRFKDAVGLPNLRSHHHKQTKDGVDFIGDAAYVPPIDSEAETPDMKNLSEPGNHIENATGNYAETRVHDEEAHTVPSLNTLLPKSSDSKPPEIVVDTVASQKDSESPRKESTARTEDEEQDLELYKSRSSEMSSDREEVSGLAVMSLRRPQSCADLSLGDDSRRRDNYWPRHLSFSTVEEVVLGWERLEGQKPVQEKAGASLEEAIAHEDIAASDARIFSSRILELSENTVPWVERQVGAVDGLNQILYDRHEEVNTVYLERLEEYQKLRERSSDLLTQEHSYCMDSMKKVELMGAKLDYELNVLGSKVEDVESGLGEFERHVIEIETRVQALIQGEEEKQSTSWLSWFGRLAGLSTQ
ncbi:hypothetical protein ASPWEDRAFT_103827 [Aspergillus wentii DTO 134E9]|uniref:STB6-like N-terminal domain-containing protein n=1 Tax=Aspergillus wentii DTO 134E9 TaxID=1073089 RepID=A0A1L9RXN4_ASPWE|nr:uncharacterized protein ASPWEDRAFT_103827 [Aspergillus wentii DTO 134E9]KAI9931664.1 hypothetical protein MW887_010241 [Aspergillus wentii]OJJ39663.1 hypothetical protein ASPWEDRAFT_103827 [Aspergillus wentii DTO 134E9]